MGKGGYFIPQTLLNGHPPLVSSDPDLLNQRSSYGVGVRSAIVKRWCPFIISAMFDSYSNPLLAHLQGNIAETFLFGWDGKKHCSPAAMLCSG